MPLTFHHKQLSNGLDIIAERNSDAHSFAVGSVREHRERATKRRK